MLPAAVITTELRRWIAEQVVVIAAGIESNPECNLTVEDTAERALDIVNEILGRMDDETLLERFADKKPDGDATSTHKEPSK